MRLSERARTYMGVWALVVACCATVFGGRLCHCVTTAATGCCAWTNYTYSGTTVIQGFEVICSTVVYGYYPSVCPLEYPYFDNIGGGGTSDYMDSLTPAACTGGKMLLTGSFYCPGFLDPGGSYYGQGTYSSGSGTLTMLQLGTSETWTGNLAWSCGFANYFEGGRGSVYSNLCSGTIGGFKTNVWQFTMTNYDVGGDCPTNMVYETVGIDLIVVQPACP